MLDPRIVRESFTLIDPVAEKATEYFYARLFVENARLRNLFPAAMDVQRDRLFRALTRIVWSLETPEALAAYLSQLGRDHRKFGVEREHYDAVGRALLTTLRNFSGEAWTPEVESAWAQAYSTAAGLMIAAAEQDASEHPPWWVGEVVDHDLRTPDIAVLTVRPHQRLPYEPGQYVTIQTTRWPRVWRPFSIANASRGDGLLRFHVRALPAGWLSGALVRHTKPGDKVFLGHAAGTMTLASDSGRDLLLVAGGTGLAPLKALAEQIAKTSRGRRVHLVFGARSRRELYDLPALRLLSSAYPWLTIVPVVEADPSYEGQRGQALDAIDPHADWTDRDAYVAGPPEMITATVAHLRRLGIPPEQIHHDMPDAAPVPDSPSTLTKPH